MIAYDISLYFYLVFIKFVYSTLFLFHTLHNYWLVHVNLKLNALLTGYYSWVGGGVDYPLQVASDEALTKIDCLTPRVLNVKA